MKFKVGDKVKIIKIKREHHFGDDYLNQVGEIIEDYPGRNLIYDFWVKFDDDEIYQYGEEELAKAGKALPIKYVVFYKENNVDPMATFTTEKELKSWLTKAKDNEEIDFSSIRFFEVKKELKVKISFKLVG